MHKFMHKHRAIFGWLLMQNGVWRVLAGITISGLCSLFIAYLFGYTQAASYFQGFVTSMGALAMALLVWRQAEGYVHEWRMHEVGGRYFEYRRRYGGQWWSNDPWLAARKLNIRVRDVGPTFYSTHSIE